jgi:hypothetical protein
MGAMTFAGHAVAPMGRSYNGPCPHAENPS